MSPQPSTPPVQHLWEADHAYQCNEGNYFATGSQHDQQGLGPHFKSFAAFLSEWGDADKDYNLVFRWDWADSPETHYQATPYTGDDNYRNGILSIFIIGQRKGLYNWITVEVCRADEQAVRDYLKPRMMHLIGLWSPMIWLEPETEQG